MRCAVALQGGRAGHNQGQPLGRGYHWGHPHFLMPTEWYKPSMPVTSWPSVMTPEATERSWLSLQRCHTSE